MSVKTRTPTARAARQGLGLESHFPATSDLSPITFNLSAQENFAVRHLTARFGLDTTRARLTAELCWGCQ